MISKVKFVQTYTKYCDHIKAAEAESILSSYKAMYDYLEKECVDDYLMVNLKLGLIWNTLDQIRKKNIFLKDLSESWDSQVTKQCKNIVGHLWNINAENGMTESEKILFGKFCKLSNEQEDAALQLYMWMLFSNTKNGRTLLERTNEYCNKLKKAQTNEEITAILTHKDEHKNDFKARFVCAIPIPKLRLFKMFNPKTLEEAEEGYAKLEEMADQGEICYDDYIYVRDILLSRCPQRYKWIADHKNDKPTELFDGQYQDVQKALEECEREEMLEKLEESFEEA